MAGREGSPVLPVQLGALPRGWADPMQPVLPCLPDPQPLVAPSQELVSPYTDQRSSHPLLHMSSPGEHSTLAQAWHPSVALNKPPPAAGCRVLSFISKKAFVFPKKTEG